MLFYRKPGLKGCHARACLYPSPLLDLQGQTSHPMKQALTILLLSSLLVTAWLVAADQSAPGIRVLQLSRLHLGKPGEWEWDKYEHRFVDSVGLEKRFSASPNPTEQTLLIWQKDVKQDWVVDLNGKRVGTLTTNETAQECALRIAPQSLKEGENVLTIYPPSKLDDIEIGPIRLSPLPVEQTLAGATLEVTVTDAATNNGIPCRLTLTRPDGTLQLLQAEPVAETATRAGVVYTRAGKARLTLPPGEYVLYAGRGFEWGVAQAKLSVSPGETQQVALKLTREVPTEGWVAADSHIHTFTFSRHGDAKIEERMLTIAGEGIELPIATDHNHHVDYTPVAASTGTGAFFTPVMGNEVTTPQGHFNAFPINPGARVADSTLIDWTNLISEIRATPGVKVITLNHPRDLHKGFVPLGGLQFNPVTGRHRHAEALHDVDAIEVITSGAMQSDIHLLYRDWFALLNRGHRFAAIASSDSHDVTRFILGQGRTYVAVPDGDPAKLDLDTAWRSYQQGRLLVSLGLMANVRVDEKFTVGDIATGLGETVKVRATVLGPSWVKADHVALYANGILLREQEIADEGKAGEKAVITWEVPRPRHDAHLVVIATGPGVTAPYWDIPRPYQPTSKAFVPRVIGSTNPIWLDGDGDGRFSSAFAYAKRLVGQAGPDQAKLAEALKGYDEAVGIQARSLLQTEAAP